MIVRLRPHHGMCLHYFQGKGYSGEFVRNMCHYKQLLETEDPFIELVTGTDDICARCPNNQNGRCISVDKVHTYDLQVLQACELGNGTILHYSQFAKLVHDRILTTDRREEICGNCQWNDLCISKCLNGSVNLNVYASAADD